jgi:ATP adenylyltransferase
MADVARVTRVLEEVFHPDKINHAVFGDEVSHLHFHLVPKFRASAQWKQSFPSATDTKVLSEKEYAEMIAPIEALLLAKRGRAPSPGP